MALTASEKLAATIVADAKGETARDIMDFMEGTPKAIGELNPENLGAVLEVVLGFIIGLLDAFKSNGLCEQNILNEIAGDDISEATAIELSASAKADRLLAAVRRPTWRMKARVYAELRSQLRGTGEIALVYRRSVFDVAAETDNEPLVRSVVAEGETNDDLLWV